MDSDSYWQKFALPKFHELKQNYEVDVVVIGAGITGVTTAYLLKKSGYRVALLERGRCGGVDTAKTTAHLTCVTDTRLNRLASEFGEETARAVWEAGKVSIDSIVDNIRSENIDCDFAWVPAYLFASLGEDEKKERDGLKKDCLLANELGFPAETIESVPVFHRLGVKFSNQAKFHPLKYLAALLKTIPGHGSHIFENTESAEIESKPLKVKTKNHAISCSYVVIATHNPLMGKTNPVAATLFQTKLFLYSSYVIGAKIPKESAPQASFWDTANPYHYLRIEKFDDYDYAIFGGEDHKTGQLDDPNEPYARLEKKLTALFPSAKIDARWSGQVIETPDGLPYIGESSDRQFIATGFGGNGMTFGTLGAMMAIDAFLKHENPWQKLFDVHRTKVLGGTWNYVRENKDYPYYLVRSWLAGAQGNSLRDVARNEGKVLQLDGKKVAAFRDAKGKISLHSPVCTHLKCVVAWNDAEKTWDCPCHGSRFKPTGEALTGPAEEPLEKIHRG